MMNLDHAISHDPAVNLVHATNLVHAADRVHVTNLVQGTDLAHVLNWYHNATVCEFHCQHLNRQYADDS